MSDDDVPDLGPVPTRFPATVDLVRRLVAAQFPQWADLPVLPVATEGWDNRTFHLGAEMSVRLPSASPYSLAVEKEQRWLPVLAPQLPLQIPVPLAKGAPGEGYPYVWSVYRWLDGDTARRDNVADLTEFGAALADFLAALQRVDPTHGPGPGLHNWYRGGTLATYDALTQDSLETLEDHCRTDLAPGDLADRAAVSLGGAPVWFHGRHRAGQPAGERRRAHLRHRLRHLRGGRSGLRPGDRVDAALRREPRGVPAGLSVDDETWARGRGWALWKTLATCAGALQSGGAELADATSVPGPDLRRVRIKRQMPKRRPHQAEGGGASEGRERRSRRGVPPRGESG